MQLRIIQAICKCPYLIYSVSSERRAEGKIKDTEAWLFSVKSGSTKSKQFNPRQSSLTLGLSPRVKRGYVSIFEDR